MATYLINDLDRREGTSYAKPYYPNTVTAHSDSAVTPLIDGHAYFLALQDSLNRLDFTKNPGVFIAGWVLQYSFQLPDGTYLVQKLHDIAAAGGDVRILLWCNTALYNRYNRAAQYGGQLVPEVGDFVGVVDNNIATADYYRSFSTGALLNSVMLNTLDATQGSCHFKIAVVFDDTFCDAYTGGIDMTVERDTQKAHGVPFNQQGCWHDIQAKAEGGAAVDIFDFFKACWNEMRDWFNNGWVPPAIYSPNLRKVVLTAFPPVTKISSSRTILPAISTTGEVQVLRTVPDNDSWFGVDEEWDISFATSGIYENALSMIKAVSNAEKYIYLEGYLFSATAVMDEIASRMLARPSLKVIILDHGIHEKSYSWYCVHTHILSKIPPHLAGNVRMFAYGGNGSYVHSKVMIVDDKFARIASSNFGNRSLYLDLEHGVAWEDEDSVKQFRIDLWNEHLRPETADTLKDIDKALATWSETWGSTAPAKLPFDADTVAELTPARHSQYIEFDTSTGTPTGAKIDIPYSLNVLYRFTYLSGTNDHAIITADAGAVNYILCDYLPENKEDYYADLKENYGNVSQAYTDYYDPVGNRNDLKGNWLYFYTGANAGEIRKIVAHTGKFLFFQALANAVAPGDQAILLVPVVDWRQLGSPSIDSKKLLYYQYIHDKGTPPS